MRGLMMRRLAIVVIAAGMTACGGDVNAALERLSEARHLAADLLVEFTHASDASNRAVMADTDAASVAFAQEAALAKQAVHKDVESLRPLLAGLGYTDEAQLLDTFGRQFAAYEALDRQILDLAVENTNLKAQRLSFGAAQAADDAFEQAVDAVTPANAGNVWRVKAAGAAAISAVREIEVLQAAHIAAPDDGSMAGFETRMKAQETIARGALADLSSVIDAPSQKRLAAAGDALNRFMDVNTQIVGLSRRNTNVRSLALSLDQKRGATGPCEATLRALRAALDKHGYSGGPHPGGR
jgi:hypothetical protein